MCVLAVYCGLLCLQLCLGAGGFQRDQDEQGEEETDRLHSSSRTAQGFVLLSRELRATQINLSEDPQSFILRLKTEISPPLPSYSAKT